MAAFAAFTRVTLIAVTMGAVWLLGAVPAAAQPAAIQVDGVSEQGQVIVVNVTYRCSGSGYLINVDIDDPPANKSAQGSTGGGRVFDDGSVSRPEQLVGDDRFHSKSIRAPAGQPFGPPWIFQRGEVVRVRADLGGPGVGVVPVVATDTKTFKV
jgi:hypothetical protein